MNLFGWKRQESVSRKKGCQQEKVSCKLSISKRLVHMTLVNSEATCSAISHQVKMKLSWNQDSDRYRKLKKKPKTPTLKTKKKKKSPCVCSRVKWELGLVGSFLKPQEKGFISPLPLTNMICTPFQTNKNKQKTTPQKPSSTNTPSYTFAKLLERFWGYRLLKQKKMTVDLGNGFIPAKRSFWMGTSGMSLWSCETKEWISCDTKCRIGFPLSMQGQIKIGQARDPKVDYIKQMIIFRLLGCNVLVSPRENCRAAASRVGLTC